MSTARVPPYPSSYKGRFFGILIVVAVQMLVGAIHVFFGLWMLVASHLGGAAFFGNELFVSDVYSVYTVSFGVLTLVFSFLLWLETRIGWVGTALIAVFVVVADSLTILDLPSIPGIPKFAGYGEISYSILLMLYLSQRHIRARYRISLPPK